MSWSTDVESDFQEYCRVQQRWPSLASNAVRHSNHQVPELRDVIGFASIYGIEHLVLTVGLENLNALVSELDVYIGKASKTGQAGIWSYSTL